MIIDFHTHIFEHAIAEKRSDYFDDQIFSLLYSSDKSKIIDHNSMIKSMIEQGIDFAVAMGFPWEKGKFCEKQNRYLKEVKKVTAGKIIPFGSIPLNDKYEIGNWIANIKELGLAGIGEIAFYNEGLTYRKADILQEIFASAVKYSLPVCLHVSEPVGHDYTGKHITDLSVLYSILKDFPEMTIILAHWGGGLLFYELMNDVKAVLKNVYYDTAASPYLYREEIFETAVKLIGSEKILFGSDFPLINFTKYLSSIEKSVPNENDKKNIFEENARKILAEYFKNISS